jgi:hypothetical protein
VVCFWGGREQRYPVTPQRFQDGLQQIASQDWICAAQAAAQKADRLFWSSVLDVDRGQKMAEFSPTPPLSPRNGHFPLKKMAKFYSYKLHSNMMPFINFVNQVPVCLDEFRSMINHFVRVPFFFKV